MPIYRNRTDKDLVVPLVGLVKAGSTIETTGKIENNYFEEVTTPQAPAPQPMQQPVQPKQ